ncbi:DUF2726 domain-containing protein [Acinetobacter populi]|uniref:DUF2726 domain-containing protein n=1 Tax=Acinetobacter populi TaxID=1582270 RepID=A0A1Z9YUK7_9GAMM|nr:DUF2726 domain-containing protein [Acinetobacter populi]MCH4248032.1 DUF2726 domain-containing protein [Acinetobacter populi]OUY05912.1 hypothetical protein CAP51_14460 [Acinetobacter populi]
MWFLLPCLLFLGIILFYKLKYKQQYFSRRLMTPFEQKMFTQLKRAFPENDVLCQVAFSALITNDHYKIRSRFNRKVTDFVLINSECDVIAIIELDDPSHLNKVAEDQFRDKMLNEAGYTVYRFCSIPSVQELRKSIPNKKSYKWVS